MQVSSAHKRGFSLVELSIVLVILGLLIGGVLGGQALIRASEIRSVATDLDKFRVGFNIFRQKYLGLPGDISNATSFWGAAHATPATCATTAGTGTQTCNGDADGIYSFSTSAGGPEPYRAWQHLSNAGLVEGAYTGISGPGHASADAIPGTNVPKSRISGAGYVIDSMPALTGSLYYFDNASPTNRLTFGTDGGAASSVHGAVVSPQEAWAVDNKIDDGKPGLGSVSTWKGGYAPGGVNCSTDPSPTVALYNIVASETACAVFYRFN